MKPHIKKHHFGEGVLRYRCNVPYDQKPSSSCELKDWFLFSAYGSGDTAIEAYQEWKEDCNTPVWLEEGKQAFYWNVCTIYHKGNRVLVETAVFECKAEYSLAEYPPTSSSWFDPTKFDSNGVPLYQKEV